MQTRIVVLALMVGSAATIEPAAARHSQLVGDCRA